MNLPTLCACPMVKEFESNCPSTSTVLALSAATKPLCICQLQASKMGCFHWEQLPPVCKLLLILQKGIGASCCLQHFLGNAQYKQVPIFCWKHIWCGWQLPTLLERQIIKSSSWMLGYLYGSVSCLGRGNVKIEVISLIVRHLRHMSSSTGRLQVDIVQSSQQSHREHQVYCLKVKLLQLLEWTPLV